MEEIGAKTVWRIEYTNHPPLTRKRRKVLEMELAKAMKNIESLLDRKGDGGFPLGEGFWVESVWVEDLGKHHVAVYSFKEGDEWVATVVLENHPTMTLNEVKAALKSMGFSERSLYALGATNEETVGEILKQTEAGLMDEAECVREIRLVNKILLETFLKKRVIGLSDGLLDAFRKIEATLRLREEK